MESYLRSNLRQATFELDSRGQSIAAKWACEQLLGLADHADDTDDTSANWDSALYADNSNPGDAFIFASSLIGFGEFQRCAHVLRKGNFSDSKLGIFLYFYSLYMAGEKIKDQHESEQVDHTMPSKSSGNEIKAVDNEGRKISKNPSLVSLYCEMVPYYKDYLRASDGVKPAIPIKMDGFILFLFAVVVRDIRRQVRIFVNHR